MTMLKLAAACALLALATHAPPAAATEGSDNCKGYIDSLPATISTAGTWCLRSDLTFTANYFGAIMIEAENVTLDCNGHDISEATGTHSGVTSYNVDSVTVRNCRVRGFQVGINLSGGQHHLIEDNVVLDASVKGIFVSGTRNLVRRNRVYRSVGTASSVYGIDANADIIDNVVDVVQSTNASLQIPMGITTQMIGADVRGNVVRGVDGYYGINLGNPGFVSGNHVVALDGGVNGIGSNGSVYCLDNTFHGYAQAPKCLLQSGNLSN